MEPEGLISIVVRVIAVALLVLLNAFFVAAEFALVKVRGTQIEMLAQRGSRSARVGQHVLQHLDRYLSACQVGITMTSLGLGWVGLGGLTLREIRATLGERLRDADGGPEGGDLLNIFIAEGEGLFELDVESDGVVLGSTELLAGQPEFSSNERIRGLLSLTERRDLLREALLARHQSGLSITIGSEHADQRLTDFTLVTSSYRIGDLTGVIGVIGPTRMPYDKIIGLVQHTSRLVEGLMA